MFRTRFLPAVALAAGLLACAGAAAQPGAPVRPPAPLPVVPATAAAFVTLRVSDLAKHPDLKPVLADLAKQPDALAGVTEVIGVSPLELDRVTLFWSRLGRGPADPVLVVTTTEPFNEARVLKTLRARPVFDGPRDFGGFDGPGAAPATKSAPPAVKSSEPIGPAGPPQGIGPGEAPPPKPLEPGAPGKEDGDLTLCASQLPGDVADPLFYALDRGPFAVLFLVDERTLVFLPGRGDTEFATLALLSASLKKNATGPLAEALADAGKHTLAAGVYLPPLFKEFNRRVEPELAPYTALLAARTAVLTGNVEKGAKLNLTLTFDGATAAKRAAPVLEEGLATLAAKVEEAAGEMRDSRRPMDKASAPVLGALAAGLKKAAVKADGTAVTAAAEVDLGPAGAKALGDLLQAMQSRRKAELRMNNLKQIGLALHSYHDTYGRLPSNVYGPKGELLLSWRVQILPYLEQDALYKQFKLDEPWDSENNKKLIEQMPKVFEAPDRASAKGQTFYQAFVQRERLIPVKGLFGRPWLKDGEKQGLTFSTFTDGLSNTLAVVEAGEGVVWSKPADLPFGGAVPALGEKDWDRTPALLFDGSTRMFPTKMTPEAFWPHVTINGGEITQDPDDDRRGPFGGRPRAPADAPLTTPPELKEPTPAREPEPLPIPKAAGERLDVLEERAAQSRAREQVLGAQVEAAKLLVARLEQLAGNMPAADAQVTRARTVLAESLARLQAARAATAEAEVALKAAKEKAPRK